MTTHDAETGRENVSYLFDFDGMTVLHLGDLSHVPDQSVVEALGAVHRRNGGPIKAIP